MGIEFYKEFGEYGYLANYSNHGFTVDNVYYPTVEHFYQASKFDNPAIIQQILNCKTPKEASNIGRDRNNIRIPNFREIKLDKMYEGVYYKFSQNKEIRSKLIETRNQEIKEMSVKESFWGVGPDFDGRNEIGKILMRVREQVKKDVLDSILSNCRDQKVYIVGHAKPDLDSIFSSFLLTHILKSMGVDAVFAVRDEEFVDSSMIHDFLKEDYEVVSDFSDKKFILVDHNLLAGIPKENVIGAIDHHRISGEVEDIIEMEYASTGLLIYDLFKDQYDFSEEMRTIVALTVFSDTEFLTSSRFSLDDKKIFEELHVDMDPEEYKKKYLKTSNFHLNINDAFFQDYKEYDYDSLKINRSMIKSYTKERIDYYDQYVHEMKKHSIHLLIWCDYEELATYICYNGISLQFPYFTTSTILVLDFLKREKYLSK